MSDQDPHGYIQSIVLQPDEEGWCRPDLPTPGVVLGAHLERRQSLMSVEPVAHVVLDVLARGEQKTSTFGVRRVFRLVNAEKVVRDIALVAPGEDPGAATGYVADAPYLRYVCRVDPTNAHVFEKVVTRVVPAAAGETSVTGDANGSGGSQ